jgi:hypothetical protein
MHDASSAEFIHKGCRVLASESSRTLPACILPSSAPAERFPPGYYPPARCGALTAWMLQSSIHLNAPELCPLACCRVLPTYILQSSAYLHTTEFYPPILQSSTHLNAAEFCPSLPT